MSKFDENLFGRIAVFKNYLTWEQLDDCLRLQRTEPAKRKLGEILRDRGYLTDEQLQNILEIRKKKVRKLLRNPKEVRENDKGFGLIAVEAGVITFDQLEAAMLEQDRLSKLSLHFRIGEILVASKAMTMDDVEKVLSIQGKRILVCTLCDAHFNVLGYAKDRAYSCLKCQAELTVPEFLDTVAVDGYIDHTEQSQTATAAKVSE